MATRTTSGTGRGAGGTETLAASVRKRLGLTRAKFSRLVGFSERSLADWESGRVGINEAALRQIRELDRLRKRLAKVVKADVIPEWLYTPNKAFDGLKPVELIERGEMDRLWSMVFYLESGVAS